MTRIRWLLVGVSVGYVVALVRISYKLAHMSDDEFDEYMERMYHARQ